MKKRNIISFVLVLVLFMTGCVRENGNAAEQDDTRKFYYTIEETTLPSPEKSIMVPEGGRVLLGTPMMFGEYVLCTASVNDKEYKNLNFYVQILEPGAEEWKRIDILNSGFELDGVQYDGFNSGICPSADEKMYTQAYILDKGSYLGRLEADGIKEIICAVPEEFEEEWDSWNDALTRDKDGNFYSFSKNNNVIKCYDSILQMEKTIEVPKAVYGILQGEAGADVYWYGSGTDNKPVVGNLTHEKILFEGIEGLATDYVAGISANDTLFLADTQNVWKVVDGVLHKAFPFTQNGYLISEIYGIKVVEEKEILLLTKMDGDLIFLRMKEIDKPLEKQEIVMAFASQHLGLNKSIARFNRQNAQYYISVILPEEGEEEEAFQNRIQMQISAGKGPDILGHDIVLNLPDYVENGYLECVDDVFGDNSVYLEAALEDSQINGKFYGVPYECIFDVIAYSTEDTGERTSWTLPELMQAVRASDAEILQEDMDGVSIVKKYALYDNTNTTYIDWEKGESHLTEQPFLDLLAFAKDYADVGNVEKKAFGKTITFFNELRHIKEVYSYFQEGAAFLGYPRAEGNGIYVNSRALYLNANSDCKEGARAFLKFLISEEEQRKYVTYDATEQMREEGIKVLKGHFIQFPVSLKAYETIVELELDKDKDNVIHTDTGTIQTDILYTDDMIEQFYFMLEHAEPGNYNAASISNVISEELAPYFAGSITASEAAEKLDNRVQLYLDETVN